MAVELDGALTDILASYTKRRAEPMSVLTLYGPVTANASPIHVYLAFHVHLDIHGGVAAYFGPSHPLNCSSYFSDQSAVGPAALVLSALLALSAAPPQRALRIYSLHDFLPRSVCHWGVNNALADWKVPHGAALRAVTDLICARPAPVSFSCLVDHSLSSALPEPYHAAHSLAQQAARAGGRPLDVAAYRAPAEWAQLPEMSTQAPTLPLQKVFTQLKPVAQPAYSVGQPHVENREGSDSESDTSWAVFPSVPPSLKVLRRKNLGRVLSSLSDNSFWRCLREFTSDKPRHPPVSAEQLKATFMVRMNPPKQLPPDFDSLQHAIYSLYAANLPKHTVDRSQQGFFSRPFSGAEVEQVKAHIRTHCKGSVTGLDGVGYDTVLDIPSDSLRELFQLCVDRCAVPSSWLTAVVAAVKKPRKDASDPDSYRTIGLESCLLKTLTLLIDRRLRDWAETNGHLPDYQSGFRKGHRTVNNAFVLRTIIDKARSL